MDTPRFTRIKLFPGYRWPTKEMPVTLVRGAELRDEKTGYYWLQLKWMNTSGLTIDYMKIRVECFIGEDAAQPQQMLLEELAFEYMNQSVSPDATFGEKAPIRLPWPAVATIVAKPVEIAFRSGQTWHVGSGWKESFRAGAARGAPPAKPAAPTAVAQSAPAPEVTISTYSAEPAGPEESARERRKPRRKARWALRIAGILIVAAGIALYPTCVKPALDYVAAGRLYREGRYEEAVTAFAALGDFKDSEAWAGKSEEGIRQRQYDAAVIQFQAGNFLAAKRQFEALGGYLDSAEKAKAADDALWQQEYEMAIALFEAGKFEEAKRALEDLGGYADSEARIRQCETAMQEAAYQQAKRLLNTGDYAEAHIAFSQLGAYLDSADWAAVSLTLSAGQTMAEPSARAATVPIQQTGEKEIVGTVVCNTKSRSNLRSGPSTAYEIVGTAVDGDTFACSGKSTDGAWYVLRLSDGTTAYLRETLGVFMPGEGAQTSLPPATPTASLSAAPVALPAARGAAIGDVTVTAEGGATLRSADRADAPLVASATKGERLACTGVSEQGWYRVLLANGEEAYISPKLAAFAASQESM